MTAAAIADSRASPRSSPPLSSDTPVFTGLGIVAPTGLGVDRYWAATRAGRSAITPITRFDTSGHAVRVAGQVPDVDGAMPLPARLLPQTDRSTRFALVAAEWALQDAGLDPSEHDEFAGSVVTATAFGGMEFITDELQRLWSRGPAFVTAYMSYAWFYGVNTGQISIRHDIKGPSGSMVTGQAGGLDALGQARRRLRSGRRFVVTGGTDAPVCPFGLVSTPTGDMLNTSATDQNYRPFDRAAAGHVLGEGSAMMVLEPLGAARERGAPQLYGALSGYAATFDPAPGHDRASNLGEAAALAIADADLRPGDIDVVFADGAATPEGDAAEAAAITTVFGAAGVPVTVPKAATGRMYGAAGAVDVATALLSIRDGVVPPTIGVPHPATDLDLVLDEARHLPVRHALVLARGDGGFNAAVVVSGIDS